MEELLRRLREQYPEYGDMSDDQLARALHRKFYSDMSFSEFTEAAERRAAESRLAAGGGSAVGDFVHQAAEGATLGQAEKFAGVAAGQLPNQFARPDDPRFQNREARRDEAAAAFQQRTDDLQRLAPGASLLAGLAGGAATGRAALPSLRAAGGAVRGVAGGAIRNPLVRTVARRAAEGAGLAGGGLGMMRLLAHLFDR